jgi:integrase
MGGKILKTETKVKVDSTLEFLLASVKSPASKRTYRTNFHRFLTYTEMKNGQQILDTSPKKLTELIIGYVMQLTEEINPNTIPTYLATVRSFLEINDIDLKWKKIKKFYPERIKLSGQGAYSTEQVKKMLSVTRKLQHKALIQFYASTACRVGAVLDIQTKRPLCMGDF